MTLERACGFAPARLDTMALGRACGFAPARLDTMALGRACGFAPARLDKPWTSQYRPVVTLLRSLSRCPDERGQRAPLIRTTALFECYAGRRYITKRFRYVAWL